MHVTNTEGRMRSDLMARFSLLLDPASTYLCSHFVLYRSAFILNISTSPFLRRANKKHYSRFNSITVRNTQCTTLVPTLHFNTTPDRVGQPISGV
ncbi:hypothetical protein ABKN59_001013 [Abortiporus biennis]